MKFVYLFHVFNISRKSQSFSISYLCNFLASVSFSQGVASIFSTISSSGSSSTLLWASAFGFAIVFAMFVLNIFDKFFTSLRFWTVSDRIFELSHLKRLNVLSTNFFTKKHTTSTLHHVMGGSWKEFSYEVFSFSASAIKIIHFYFRSKLFSCWIGTT